MIKPVEIRIPRVPASPVQVPLPLTHKGDRLKSIEKASNRITAQQAPVAYNDVDGDKGVMRDGFIVYRDRFIPVIVQVKDAPDHGRDD